MSLDPAEHLADLTPAQPTAADPASQADDHLRAIKKAISQTFPNGFDSGMGVTQALLNGFDGRVSALEAIPAPTPTTPAIGSMTISSVGDHAVTGVGFQPSVVMFYAFGTGGTLSTQTQISIGISGAGVLISGHAGTASTPSLAGYEGFATGDTTEDAYVLMQGGARNSSVFGRGTVKSLDADGFTITETVGTRTANIIWMAFK